MQLPFLTEEHELTRRAVREFVEREIKPLAKKIDSENWYPRQVLEKAAHLGLLEPTVQQNGQMRNCVNAVIIQEEISKASASCGSLINVQSGLASDPISIFGTKEQKKNYLEPLMKGEKIGCFCLTEPCCGSDAASIQTRAKKENNYYILNGRKIYITQGMYADIFIVFARTGPEETGPKGITAFIVEREKTVTTTPIETMGHRGTGLAEITFNNTHVPKENILGEEGRGFRIAMETLNIGRVRFAARGVGIAAAAFEESLGYAKQRKAFGKPIAEHQAIQFTLADMLAELQQTRLITYYAAWLFDKNQEEYKTYASIAKLAAAKTAVETTRKATQILGGYGYTKESTAERLYRDAKLLEIAEGTNEIQKLLIARTLLAKT